MNSAQISTLVESCLKNQEDCEDCIDQADCEPMSCRYESPIADALNIPAGQAIEIGTAIRI
jgi:hypothetical protein